MSKKALLVVISCVFALFITGCQNPASFNSNGNSENNNPEPEKNEAPYLTFNFDGGNERTVNPGFDCSKLTAITLKGTVSDGVEETLFTEKNYSEITDAEFKVPLTKTGTYSFVMTAKLNERNFSCSLLNTEIKNGENALTFSMSFTSQDENFVPGTGSIEINLTIKNHSDIKYAKVSLLKSDETPAYEEEKLVNSGNGIFTYAKSNVPAGNYTIKYSFYNGENLLGYYMETVNVSKDLSSTAIREEEAVADYYKIIYALGGGSWVEGYEPASAYSKYGIASLPAWNKAFKENDGVDGWYYDESFTEKATNENIKTKTGDITLYAKYAHIAYAEGFGNLVNRIKASGATETEPFKILDADPDLGKIADALKDENVKVGIDLSGCTELTTMPDARFDQCHSLVKVTLPATLESIGAASFKECENLKDITIPDKVTFIGSDAFANCASLTSISIPKGVTEIPYSLFSDCSSLKTIIIPETITTIYDTAFYNCSSLEEIVIPDTVTSLIENSLYPHSIFYGCSSLKKVTAPCRFKGDSFFEKCFGELFSGITFAYNHSYTGENIYCDCHEDYQASNSGNCGTSARFLFDEETGIFTIEGSGEVTENEFSEFAEKIKTVTIDDNITDVYKNMFTAFTSLEKVTAPCTIRKNAGIDETKVTVDWHHNFKKYDDSACSTCGEQQKVYKRYCSDSTDVYCNYYDKTKTAVFTFESTAGQYGGGTLKKIKSTCNCPGAPEDPEYDEIMKAETVIIGSGITTIDSYAFTDYKNLKEVQMTSVTDIGNNAFESLSKLEKVVFSNVLEYIGESAFYSCSSLKSIYIPDSVYGIDIYAFVNCANLVEVTIGSGVTFDEDITSNYIFNNCSEDLIITAPSSAKVGWWYEDLNVKWDE